MRDFLVILRFFYLYSFYCSCTAKPKISNLLAMANICVLGKLYRDGTLIWVGLNCPIGTLFENGKSNSHR